jgi:ADP-heptose:LPS heptosyltransferase
VRRVFAYDPRSGTVDPELTATSYDVVADLHTRGVPLDDAHERLIAGLRARTRVGYASPYSPSPAAYSLPARGRGEHAVEYYARSVAPLIDGPLGAGRIAVTAAERARAAARLPPRAVCLAPGARYPWKRWPAESYAALARRLAGEGFSPVLVGHHPFDEPYVRAVRSLCGPETVAILDDTPALADVMAAAGLVVANTSGLTALAAASGARVVCVHSHTLPAMWRPWGEHHADLTGRAGEPPCDCAGPDGPAPHDLATPCGKRIPVEDVLAAVLGPAEARGAS